MCMAQRDPLLYRLKRVKGGITMEMTLDRLSEGQCAYISALDTAGGLRQRLLDHGLIEGTIVRCLRKSPKGDPVIYCIRGSMLAIRRADSRSIRVVTAP